MHTVFLRIQGTKGSIRDILCDSFSNSSVYFDLCAQMFICSYGSGFVTKLVTGLVLPLQEKA
jgi:hypothetical protein